MAQSTFNNGDTLGVARTAINSNATDAETRLDVLENASVNAVVATSDGKYPALDGSLITNISGGYEFTGGFTDRTTG